MVKEIRLKRLDEMYESGTISKEEYEAAKTRIAAEPDHPEDKRGLNEEAAKYIEQANVEADEAEKGHSTHHESHTSEKHHHEHPTIHRSPEEHNTEENKEKIEEKENKNSEEEKTEEPPLKSDKPLLIGILVIIVLFGALFTFLYLNKDPEVLTIPELYELNLQGKLDADQGYIYNGVYSFVKFGDEWYTELMSPSGSRLYNIGFRYGPKDIETISIGGELDNEKFNNASTYFVTFNPTGSDFAHVAVAVGDWNSHMVNLFGKEPIAACDKNETVACRDRPIVTCDTTEDLVLYVKESNQSSVYFDDNCIVVEGTGFDMVKGIDRVLMDFYGFIEN